MAGSYAADGSYNVTIVGGNTSGSSTVNQGSPGPAWNVLALGRYTSTLPNYTDGASPVLQVDVNGRLLISSIANAVFTKPLPSAGTNRSTTVGTTAAVVMNSNNGRQGWKIKNDTTGDIWINFDTTATAAPGGGNIKVPAGGYLASEPSFVETGAMSAIGSAAGLNITVREH